MKQTSKVVLRMEGPEDNARHLSLSVLKSKIEQFQSLLEKITEKSSGEKIAFSVTDLSHSSPVALECVPLVDDPMTAARVVESVADVFGRVMGGKSKGIPRSIFGYLDGISKPTPEKISRIEVETHFRGKKRSYALDANFRASLASGKQVGTEELGDIIGKLERINVHGNLRQFTIFTASSSIVCHFDEPLLKKLSAALGKNVCVSGRCFFRPNAALPHKIEVRDIDVLARSGAPTNLKKLIGIAPNATSDKTTAEFVRDLRDAWER